MPMTPLGALIEECKRRFQVQHHVELTNGDIARRSGVLSRGRVQQLAQNPIKQLPEPETLRGLALGLGVPDSVVLERALQSTGYLPAPLHSQGTPDAASIEDPQVAREVSEAQRAVEAQPATPPVRNGRRGPVK
jgi:transcriptional regulator with XRE-family HTH domain